jgi:hypothetical protein
MPPLRFAFCLAFALAPAAVTARGDVIVVQAGGPFATLQAAVDAAQDGDTILVKGSWNGQAEAVQILDKGLTLIGDLGATVKLGSVSVRSLDAGKTVLLRHLQIVGQWPFDEEGALELFQNDGRVRVEACSITGSGGSTGTWTPEVISSHDGQVGASVSFCADAAFHACTISGGVGATLTDDGFELNPSSGGDGLTLRSSTVVMQGCILKGGDGGHGFDGGESGGSGGHALENKTAVLTLEDCRLSGGDYGSGDCSVSGCGSAGGAGTGLLSSFAAASTTLRASALAGGKKSTGGQNVGMIVLAGVVGDYAAAANPFTVTSPVREQGEITLAAGGKPGDALFLWMALAPGSLVKPAFQGSLLIGPPIVLVHLPMGVVPADGPAIVTSIIPELGVDTLTAWLQLVVSRNGETLLGPWASVTLLDESL